MNLIFKSRMKKRVKVGNSPIKYYIFLYLRASLYSPVWLQTHYPRLRLGLQACTTIPKQTNKKYV